VRGGVYALCKDISVRFMPWLLMEKEWPRVLSIPVSGSGMSRMGMYLSSPLFVTFYQHSLTFYPFRKCLAILQGHTSLVGQIQLRNSTLVTGGSDGSVRVWSLDTFTPIHRLAAHDNSVTSLQFDDSRIVSGGSDGRVKVWDLSRGVLIRELGLPAEAVWRVVFEEEKAVVLASRANKTVMEVWSFAPPPDDIPSPVSTRYSGAVSPALSDLPYSEPAISPLPMLGSTDGQLGAPAAAGPSGLRSEIGGSGLGDDDSQSHYYDDAGRIEPVASSVSVATQLEKEQPQSQSQRGSDVVMSDEHAPSVPTSSANDGTANTKLTLPTLDSARPSQQQEQTEPAADPMSMTNSPSLESQDPLARMLRFHGSRS